MSWTKPSNFKVEILSHGKEQLAAALAIIMAQETATHYYSPGGAIERLTFLWGTESSGVYPLFVPAKANTLVEGILEWLQRANYPKEPDMDGSVTKGFKITSDRVGYAIFTIEPAWAEFHK